ncbi:unnamed protein product [Meloidogyne enterolobii]|uniref:Uncharacterized protein n=1 Tax=Meloidogyne enterolobii TaxID=390850 RepID=A0ACB0ZMN8_MELEN
MYCLNLIKNSNNPSLIVLPQRYVRRGFSLVVNSSTGVLSTFLAHFASTYVGLTQIELELGSEAFQRGVQVHSVQEVDENNYNFSGFLFCFW